MEDANNDELETITTTRQRKKKGTLTKLKEKKQKGLGSNTSLNVESKTDLVKVDGDPQIVQNSSTTTTADNQNFFQFSTKDKIESNDKLVDKPKPKARVSKRPQIASDEKDNLEKQDNEKEKIKLLDDLENSKNVKINGEQKIDSILQSSGFVPKPPLTPRTPKSTPRTPRGYIPFGKLDKQNQDGGSSSSGIDVDDKQTAGSTDIKGKPLNDSNQIESENVMQRLTRQPPVQNRPAKRLLNRRGSKDSLSKDTFVEGDNEIKNVVSTPSNPKLNNISSNKNIEDIKSEKSITASSPENPDILSKGKYLKSSKKKSVLKNDSNEKPRADNQSLSQLSLRNLDQNESSINSLDMKEVNSKVRKVENENNSSSMKAKFAHSPPSSVRLDPISPLHHPPPLSEEFTSNSLRTSYKIDSNAKNSLPLEEVDKISNKSDSAADRLSQKSFTSTSVLPLITTKEARSRMFMLSETTIGSCSGSYLGVEELTRYFPNKKVKVFVGTWNMNELKDVNAPLQDFILPEKCEYVQDIYAIGTQENDMNKKEWELTLQELLISSHVMYHSVSHGSLHLVIFIRRDLIWFCSNPEDDIISLRALTMVKTKGAIGISMRLFGTSYLFINCHLTSDRDNDISRKKLRLENYFKVIREMRLPKTVQNSPSIKKSGDVTTAFDCVFWFGDLNFRIERERQAVVGKVNEITSEEFPNFETLLGGDQLLKYMSEDKIFGGFQEGRINFYPTFKFDLNKDLYDSSTKSRVPSYTDRVVFRCKKKNDIQCLHYDAVMSIKVSDHRPVFGHYETSIRPGEDGVTYSPGHFDRTIYLEALRRRVTKKSGEKKQSAICLLQ
uniref:Inositol polyphosphate-related phosphatase domain-containing protein n=1 Tax=Biomphalaria glabrata TaxID=6526 RepID=A0A2C9M3J9_BIOGL